MGLIRFFSLLGKKSDSTDKSDPPLPSDGYSAVPVASNASTPRPDSERTPPTTAQPPHEHEPFGSSFNMRFAEGSEPPLSSSPPAPPAPRRHTQSHPPPPEQAEEANTPHWGPYYLFDKSSNPEKQHYVKID